MVDRQEAEGKPQGAIIPMDDGRHWIFKVLDIRPTTGEYDGFLVDCECPGGEAFSINGHKVLRDKINNYFLGEPMWFEVNRDGKLGKRAVNYHVWWLKGSDESILTDKDIKGMLRETYDAVAELLKAAPQEDESVAPGGSDLPPFMDPE